MYSPPRLSEEEARLASLAEYDLFGEADDVDLTEVVELATRIFDVPIALVTLVGRDTVAFKAATGVDACLGEREGSFCDHAIAQNDIFHVTDAAADIRFAANPTVRGMPHIRFYAGVPLLSPGGMRSVRSASSIPGRASICRWCNGGTCIRSPRSSWIALNSVG